MHANCQNSESQELIWVLSLNFQRILKGEDHLTECNMCTLLLIPLLLLHLLLLLLLLLLLQLPLRLRDFKALLYDFWTINNKMAISKFQLNAMTLLIYPFDNAYVYTLLEISTSMPSNPCPSDQWSLIQFNIMADACIFFFVVCYGLTLFLTIAYTFCVKTNNLNISIPRTFFFVPQTCLNIIYSWLYYSATANSYYFKIISRPIIWGKKDKQTKTMFHSPWILKET